MYLVFSNYEKNFYTKNNFEVKKFYPVGSIKSAAALDFFGEFEDTTDTTPKKRPHGDIGTSTTNTRGRKRR